MQNFDIGCTYEFKGERGSIQLRFNEYDGKYYKCTVRGGTLQPESIGSEVKVWRGNSVLLHYRCKKIHDPLQKADLHEVDWYGRNVELNYKNPKLLDMYIDMALDTQDEEWFKQLCKAKRKVSV